MPTTDNSLAKFIKASLGLYSKNFFKLLFMQSLALILAVSPPLLILDLAFNMYNQISIAKTQAMSQMMIADMGITTWDMTYPPILLILSLILVPYLILKIYKIILTRPITKITFKNFAAFLISGLLITIVSSTVSFLISYSNIPNPEYFNIIPSIAFIILSFLTIAHIASGTTGMINPILISIKLIYNNLLGFVWLLIMAIVTLIFLILPLSFGIVYQLESSLAWLLILFPSVLVLPIIHTSISAFMINSNTHSIAD